MAQHPDRHVLAKFARLHLSSEVFVSVYTHIGSCRQCRAIFKKIARGAVKRGTKPA
ncbi:hypothetical protein HYV30_01555 [Candidatus Kaiserbacteria bacterium]|nr:hypothetical protein [Candidatus Kaiserbacteria bacterium]